MAFNLLFHAQSLLKTERSNFQEHIQFCNWNDLVPFFHVVFAIILGAIFHSFLFGTISFLLMLPLGKITFQIVEFYQCIYNKLSFLIFRLTKPDQYKNLILRKTLLIKNLKDINIFVAD